MFGMTESESKKLHEWSVEHDKTCPLKYNQGAIGGRTTYCFTPTSLGTVVKVKCACGEEIDISDYDW